MERAWLHHIPAEDAVSAEQSRAVDHSVRLELIVTGVGGEDPRTDERLPVHLCSEVQSAIGGDPASAVQLVDEHVGRRVAAEDQTYLIVLRNGLVHAVGDVRWRVVKRAFEGARTLELATTGEGVVVQDLAGEIAREVGDQHRTLRLHQPLSGEGHLSSATEGTRVLGIGLDSPVGGPDVREFLSRPDLGQDEFVRDEWLTVERDVAIPGDGARGARGLDEKCMLQNLLTVRVGLLSGDIELHLADPLPT